MDDVVSYAGMLWLFRKYRLQDSSGLFLIHIALVDERCGGKQRESMENGGFVIIWVMRLNLFHGSLISLCASGMVNLV
jgi:hypothetical protein